MIVSAIKPLSLSIFFALGGCWFDSNGSNTSSNKADNNGSTAQEENQQEVEQTEDKTTLEGRYAIGAPLAGANVNLNCSGYTKQNATMTNATGHWSFAVPTANLPCLVNVGGGTANGVANSQNLYTLSQNNQIQVNVTPITSLALSHAANVALGVNLAQLTQQSSIDFQKINAQLNASIEKLKQDLINKGYSYPTIANFNPFFTLFQATAGNAYDDLLEALMSKLQSSNVAWNTLLNSYATGASLPSANTSSGGNTGGNNGGGSNTGGSNTIRELGLATLSSYSTANKEDFFAGVKGTYPVAIYRVPAGKEAHIGEGVLSISGTVDKWSMQLKAADGTIISSSNSESVFIAMLTPFVGQVFLNGGTTPDKYLGTYIQSNGFIEGVAGGALEYAFRNHITAYGKAVPSAFTQLAGKWQGKTDTTLCGVNDVHVEITNTGKVSTAGIDDVKCAAISLDLTWNGNDDYIAQKADGNYLIYLDSKPDGTGNMKSIALTLKDLDQKPAQISVLTKVSGGSYSTRKAVPVQ